MGKVCVAPRYAYPRQTSLKLLVNRSARGAFGHGLLFAKWLTRCLKGLSH